MGHLSPFEWLALAEHELLLFAGAFFLLGAIDEFAVDLTWIWLRLTGRVRTRAISRAALAARPLSGRAAVLIPAWQEAEVIEFTVAHALTAWPHHELRIFVGCYANDPDTADAARRGAAGDPRVHVIVHDHNGPTTKADCLNNLYAALERDELRCGYHARMVVLHDAEDMVDPAALALFDQALDDAEFLQLPVLPEVQATSRWVGSHYCDEFAEDHGKTMLVRQALAAAVPSAGVGCAIARPVLRVMAAGGDGPFSVESLTEDYELGLRIKAAGGRTRFLRARGEDGRLVATRACFPGTVRQAVRQKARWIHGIALQGWDRLGWQGGIGERWMRLRDRRGPLTALVLFTGYVLLILAVTVWTFGLLGLLPAWRSDPLLEALLVANMLSLLWRLGMRFGFTAQEYGWREGVRAMPRVVVSNYIAILAGRRAMFAYARTLLGAKPEWDKTHHDAHPLMALQQTPPR